MILNHVCMICAHEVMHKNLPNHGFYAQERAQTCFGIDGIKHAFERERMWHTLHWTAVHTRLVPLLSNPVGWTSGSVGAATQGWKVRPWQLICFVVSVTGKGSAEPPGQGSSSDRSMTPGRRPAWRRTRRGTSATCPEQCNLATCDVS